MTTSTLSRYSVDQKTGQTAESKITYERGAGHRMNRHANGSIVKDLRLPVQDPTSGLIIPAAEWNRRCIEAAVIVAELVLHVKTHDTPSACNCWDSRDPDGEGLRQAKTIVACQQLIDTAKTDPYLTDSHGVRQSLRPWINHPQVGWLPPQYAEPLQMGQVYALSSVSNDGLDHSFEPHADGRRITSRAHEVRFIDGWEEIDADTYHNLKDQS